MASNPSAAKKTVSDIIEKLPIGGLHKFIIAAAAFGFLFDSLDMYVISYALPAVIQDWSLDGAQQGLLTSAGFWGLLIGSLIWGPITDRWGRIIGFTLTVLGFSVFTGLCGLAVNFEMLLVCRVLTGVFLGGLLPIDISFVSEFIGAEKRGKYISILPLLWPIGLLMAAVCSFLFVPSFGWRILFFIGVIPAVLSFVVRSKVPESPRWLATKGRMKEAVDILRNLGAKEEDLENVVEDSEEEKKKVSPLILLSPQYLKRFICTGGYYFFGSAGYYGFQTWLPTIYATVFGLTLTKTFSYTIIIAFSSVVGRVVQYILVDKFGRKFLFCGAYAMAAVFAVVIAFMNNPDYMLYAAIALSFFLEIANAMQVIWAPELYPSEIRATATSWSTAFARVSSSVFAIVFGFLVANGQIFATYMIIAALYGIACLLGLTLGVETKDKTLEEIGAR